MHILLFCVQNSHNKHRIDSYLVEFMCKYGPEKISRTKVHQMLINADVSLVKNPSTQNIHNIKGCFAHVHDKDISAIKDKNYKLYIGDVVIVTYNTLSMPAINLWHQQDNILQNSEALPQISSEQLVSHRPHINIVYEDSEIIVLEKPPNLVSHPEPKYGTYSVVHALLDKLQAFHTGENDIDRPEYTRHDNVQPLRPGIVHRLDKDTSGLMVVATKPFSLMVLGEQLKKRLVKRTYQAIVLGKPNLHSGTIQTLICRDPMNRLNMKVSQISGKVAITHFRLIQFFPKANCSIIECQLDTGRTHQIRVHMKHIGCPILGDKSYGRAWRTEYTKKTQRPYDTKHVSLDRETAEQCLKNFPRQALHATNLILQHPRTNQIMEFISKLPPDMVGVLEAIKTLENN